MSYDTPHTARTTFANGINPFAGLGAMPKASTPTKPKPIMQKPAKPTKTKRVTEDYSTPYKPPVLPDAEVATAPAVTLNLDDFVIDDDVPLPNFRKFGKIETMGALLGRLQLRQSVRLSLDYKSAMQKAAQFIHKDKSAPRFVIRLKHDDEFTFRVWRRE
jgi:hypothetical protein